MDRLVMVAVVLVVVVMVVAEDRVVAVASMPSVSQLITSTLSLGLTSMLNPLRCRWCRH